MYGKNIWIQISARVLLVLFSTNTIAPTLQFAFADSTQYYVDADGGNDTNDGLTPATAWQTLSKVSSTPLLQGDVVSFDCNDSWTGGLVLSTLPGSAGLPITINNYGGCPTTLPTVDTFSLIGSTYVTVSGLNISSNMTGSLASIVNSSDILIENSTFSDMSGVCVDISASSGILFDNNTITSCDYALSLSDVEGTISNNSISTISSDAITVSSATPVSISNNILSTIAESAIVYGSDTDVSQNEITNVCTTASTDCAAIKNNPSLSGSLTSTITENHIKDVGSGVTGNKNSAILIEGVDGVSISSNGIQNAEHAIKIMDASNTTISNNTLLHSRKNSLSVIQTLVASTTNNTFDGNIILQRSPDYPYIEIRDEVPGTGIVTGLIAANNNTIYPNYKPNTSYVRTVKYGGETEEYTKNDLGTWDSNVSIFQYFAYKTYTSTGSFATANLLSNGSLDSNLIGWTASADLTSAPTLSHNPTGSYSGGSMTVTPLGGPADRLWITNSATLSLTAGQTYLVTGFAKSASGNLNLRAFLHSSSDLNTVYSDRIAETYASMSGRTFSFYLTVGTTAADGTLTFETSSNDIAYEVDELSIRRVTGLIKNTNANEVLAFSNSGSIAYDQSCPGGVQCFAYVDGVNASVNWPTSIPGYTTRLVLWNNSPNIINTPSCTLNLSAGSVPTGQPVDVIWTTSNADSQILSYDTYTGSQTYPVTDSGMVTFIPPYDTISTITLDTENQVGPNQCNVQVTTTNTSPSIFPNTITGSEDASQIDGTLSGIDLNPGDTVFFESFDPPAYGSINVEMSGSIQYYPNADFCGTDSFMFRASDQWGHYVDPISQTIDVECINDVPSAVDDAFGSNGLPTTVDVLANDTDPDSIYVSQNFSVTTFTQPTNGVVTLSGASLIYEANDPVSFSGTDVFQYSFQDQSGALSTNTGTVTMSVTPVNIPPVTTDLTGSVNEDSILSGTLTGSDANGNSIAFDLVSNAGSGNVTVLPGGAYTYTPNADFFGTDSFTYKANDGMMDSNISTVTITVDPINDAPVAVGDNYALNQDTTMTVPVMNNDSDIDSTLLSITGLTLPTNGTAIINGTGVDYTPTPLYAGPDSFTYQIMDDMGLMSSTVTVNMTVVSTNSPPTANDANLSLNEDAILNANVTGSDPELSTLTFLLDTSTTNGSLVLNNDGSFTYTPATNYNGTDSFTFHVNDGSYNSTVARADITVNPINDAPTANTGTYSATGNSLSSTGNILAGSVTGNDIDGDTLSYTMSILPIHGLLSMSSTGAFTYMPALGYTGSDSFIFSVSDGSISATGGVNITISDNGVPYIPSLNNFNIIVPATVYIGTPFGVTLQARDLSNTIFSGYTGTIVFSTNSSGANLPNGGNPITFSPVDGGVRTFASGITFYETGSFSLTISDTGASISHNISINVLSIPTGGGGSGGSGSGTNTESNGTGSGPSALTTTQIFPSYIFLSANEDSELNSAPNVDSVPVFVFDDPTGLLSQLFLIRRNLNADITLDQNGFPMTSQIETVIQKREIIDLLDGVDLNDPKSTIFMRAIMKSYLSSVTERENKEYLYTYGRIKLQNLLIPEEDVRSQLIRNALLRLLENHYRKYREITERGTVGRTEGDTYNASPEDPLDLGIDDVSLDDTSVDISVMDNVVLDGLDPVDIVPESFPPEDINLDDLGVGEDPFF